MVNSSGSFHRVIMEKTPRPLCHVKVRRINLEGLGSFARKCHLREKSAPVSCLLFPPCLRHVRPRTGTPLTEEASFTVGSEGRTKTAVFFLAATANDKAAFAMFLYSYLGRTPSSSKRKFIKADYCVSHLLFVTISEFDRFVFNVC